MAVADIRRHQRAGDRGSTRAVPTSSERRRRYRSGHTGELMAVLALRAKGYRIAGRRVVTPVGEIDIIAVRGQRIAFIEVKRRASLAAAQAAVTPRQRARVRRAAEVWLSHKVRYQEMVRGFDLVFVLPWRWPMHLADAL